MALASLDESARLVLSEQDVSPSENTPKAQQLP